MKWKMVKYTKFTANENGYDILVEPLSFGNCFQWSIFKDGSLVDHASFYPGIPKSELDAKVKAEQALNKIIPPPIQQ